MTKDAKAVLTQALSLSEAERAELAGALLDSLEPAFDTKVDEAWREEVRSRVAAMESGEVETIPWAGVRQELLARLGERRTG